MFSLQTTSFVLLYSYSFCFDDCFLANEKRLFHCIFILFNKCRDKSSSFVKIVML